MLVSRAEMAQPYYKARPEVARLVPSASRHIVDVGCGEGFLGAQLKSERPGVDVRGIEPNEAAARVAEGCLDAVHCGYAGPTLPAHWPTPDCLVFADVLEHVPDPWQVLRESSRCLAPGGCVVISLPNVVYITVLWGMLWGHFRYADLGILDRTHLRFFTRESCVELVRRAGLELEMVERVRGYPGPKLVRALWALLFALPVWFEKWRGMRHAGYSVLDYVTYQYLIRARLPNRVEGRDVVS